ncbi:MAG: hypothetical protein ACLP0L_14505 [Solirubrobacteraceae bacterium]
MARLFVKACAVLLAAATTMVVGPIGAACAGVVPSAGSGTVQSVAPAEAPGVQATPAASPVAGVDKSTMQATAPVAKATAPVAKAAAPTVAKAVAPVAKAVAPVAQTVAKTAAPVAKAVAPVVQAVAKTAAPVVQTVAKTVAPMAKEVAPITQTVTNAAAPVVQTVANAAAPVVRTVAQAVAPATTGVRPLTRSIEGAPVAPAAPSMTGSAPTPAEPSTGEAPAPARSTVTPLPSGTSSRTQAPATSVAQHVAASPQAVATTDRAVATPDRGVAAPVQHPTIAARPTAGPKIHTAMPTRHRATRFSASAARSHAAERTRSRGAQHFSPLATGQAGGSQAPRGHVAWTGARDREPARPTAPIPTGAAPGNGGEGATGGAAGGFSGAAESHSQTVVYVPGVMLALRTFARDRAPEPFVLLLERPG